MLKFSNIPPRDKPEVLMNCIKSVFIALGLCGMIVSAGSAEAAWPEKPVTIISHSASGAMNDLIIRQAAALLSEELGQPFLVTNQPGGGGNMAVNSLLQEKRDGYTLCSTGPQPFGYNLFTMKTRYAIDDILPISLTNNSCMAIIAKADSGWKTVKDAYAAAKAANRPLKVGVMDNLARDIFLKIGEAEGVKVAPVPQKGGMPCLSAVLGGHVDLGLVGSIAVENTKAGKVVTLASASDKRFEAMPDISTLMEQGYDFAYNSFTTIFAAKGVPQEVIDIMSDAMIKISKKDAYKAMLEKLSVEAAPMGKEAMAEALKKEFEDKKALAGK